MNNFVHSLIHGQSVDTPYTHIMTWDEMKIKYPEYRDEMTDKREREFVSDCFNTYELTDKIAWTFWSQSGDYKEYIGKHFIIINRASEKDVHLSCLPMWNIKFEDGTVICAYPDEIFEREQVDNGRR